MGYSPERKTAVLKRMLPPNNMAIRRLSLEEGISEATLHKWRAEARGKGQLLPDADAGPVAGFYSAVDRLAFLNNPDLLGHAEPPPPANINDLHHFKHSMHRPKGDHMDGPISARIGQAKTPSA